MKKLLVTLAAVLVSVSAFAQGQINFSNKFLTDSSGASYNAGVSGDTTGATAQLWLADANGVATTALAPTTTFRTGANAPYVNAVLVDVPGVAVGATAKLIFRAFVGASWDTATAKGQSAAWTTGALGGTPAGGGLPQTPPDLSGIASTAGTSFALVAVPEPSTIALGVLGAAALLIRRRK